MITKKINTLEIKTFVFFVHLCATKSTSFVNEKDADDYIEEFYSYSSKPTIKEMIPGGLLIAEIDPVGYATGNAYNSSGKLIEHFQYAEGGEIHSSNGNGNWTIENVTPNKRYEVFLTWKADTNNSLKTIFSAQIGNKKNPEILSVVNQKIAPQKHVYGSLGQKESFQSIGQITAKNSTITITTKLSDKDKHPGNIPTGTICLIEIETLESRSYNLMLRSSSSFRPKFRQKTSFFCRNLFL